MSSRLVIDEKRLSMSLRASRAVLKYPFNTRETTCVSWITAITLATALRGSIIAERRRHSTSDVISR